MKLLRMLACAMLAAALTGGAGPVLAQGASAPAASPAKKALVQKALQLQQAAIENVGNALAAQTANQVLQVAGQALNNRVPADKRQSVGGELQAEVRKFYDDIAPTLRQRAFALAPETIGQALEDKFSEDELKVLVAWLESPVQRKFQQVAGEMLQGLGQKLVAETRPAIEPKLKALERTMSNTIDTAAATKPSPSPPAMAGSAPKK